MSVKFLETKFKGGPTSYKGRNGMGTCVGLDIALYEHHATVRPINSKGHTGQCYIEIPNEDLANVCTALQINVLARVLDVLGDKQLPTLMGISPDLDKEIEQRLKKES